MQRDYEQAIAAFQGAVRRDPKINRAWYGLGLALGSTGKHEESAQALERASALQSMNGHAWYELGMAYHTLNRRDKLAEVIAHLNRFDPKMAVHLTRVTETAHSATSTQEARTTTTAAPTRN